MRPERPPPPAVGTHTCGPRDIYSTMYMLGVGWGQSQPGERGTQVGQGSDWRVCIYQWYGPAPRRGGAVSHREHGGASGPRLPKPSLPGSGGICHSCVPLSQLAGGQRGQSGHRLPPNTTTLQDGGNPRVTGSSGQSAGHWLGGHRSSLGLASPSHPALAPTLPGTCLWPSHP